MRFNTYITEGWASKKHYRVLKAKITGISDGEPLSSPYRAVMFFDKGHWQIAPEQSFKGKFTDQSGLPAWELNNWSNKKANKEIMIDGGQKWGVKGWDAAVKEAFKYI